MGPEFFEKMNPLVVSRKCSSTVLPDKDQFWVETSLEKPQKEHPSCVWVSAFFVQVLASSHEDRGETTEQSLGPSPHDYSEHKVSQQENVSYL